MINNDQFYEKQLVISYWYVTHKLLLKNILIAVLLIIDILLIAYNIYFLIFNLVVYQKEYQVAITNLINPNTDYEFFRQFNLPTTIKVVGLQTFPANKGFDIIAEISNPSSKWFATFDYQFQISENLTPIRRSFILPGETKKIMDLAVENGDLASNVVFSNINWQKEVNFNKLYQDKFRFDIRNVKFIPSKELGLELKIAVNRVSFEIENLTAYNYKDINLLLFLKSGGQIVAVNQIPSGVLLSGQTKTLEVNFFQRLPKIDSIDIVPEVNILDPTVFLKF